MAQGQGPWTIGHVETDMTVGDKFLGGEYVVNDALQADNVIPIIMRVVKNNSGSAVLPNLLYKLKAAADGCVGTEIDTVAGVSDIGYLADWRMPAAGCPNGGYLYVLCSGPGYFKSTTSPSGVTRGSGIQQGANGLADGAGADSLAASVKYSLGISDATETVGLTVFRGVMSRNQRI